jgi:hypothetical protein
MARLRLVRKLGRVFLYGGLGGPKPYETRILDATVAALSESDAQVLRGQIRAIERLQRWNEDRMVIIGFENKEAVDKLADKSTDHCLAKVRLKGAFGSLMANVMTHRGVLSSLEFRPSPRKLKGHDLTVEVVQVHSSDPEIAAAIDREEH